MVAEQDPGPLARFDAVVRDPQTPLVIVQRLMGGESLKDLSRAWRVPYGRLLGWVAANGELSEQCKRARELAGIELRLEGLEIVDEADGAETSEVVAAAKLRAEYRERLARDLNRPLFGKQVSHEHRHTHDLGEQLRRALQRDRDERVVSEIKAEDHPYSASGGATSTDGIVTVESAVPRLVGDAGEASPNVTTTESRQPPQLEEI